ncbi:MAG: response regulator, partial [Kiritimatiellia bacterium]
VEIQVVDSGEGMNAEVKRRLFEPFFTTKGGERSGLGLAITHGIISAHNGTIHFESAPGRGTTFTIRLPLGQPGARTPEEKAETASVSKPFRILFIDDDEAVRLLIAEYLKADGHTVELASEGHEGLAKAGEGRFDLVITDSAMPGMSGSELAAAIKTIKQDLPVIMLTGFGDIMNDKNEKPAGVDLVLSKPVTRDSFRMAIVALMAGRE